MVLGSGGLSIGQAGEFDYSGSQAVKALKVCGQFTSVRAFKLSVATVFFTLCGKDFCVARV